jgi:uncharacterized DUF497 family protein
VEIFDWDDGNVEHLALHDVQVWEAEEATADRHRVSFPAHSGRIGFIGQTEDGRFLVVIIERRARLWRVVTARDATPAEKRAYRRHNR